MFNPKLWGLARHMYNDKTTKESIGIGIGLGLGLFSGGVGILPTLMAVSAAIAAAGAVRGVLDNYKRNNATISQRDVVETYNAIIQPDSNRPVLNQAASYHNALDSIERHSAQGEVGMFNIGMMRSIDKSLDWAIESASQKNESAQTLQHLKDKSQSLLQKYLGPVAAKQFVDATGEPVSQDFYKMVHSVGSLRDAIDSNEMVKEFNFGSDKVDNAQLYEGRLVYLQGKLAIIKETVAEGLLVDEADVGRSPLTLAYVMDSIAYMEQKVNPLVAVIVVKKADASFAAPVCSNADVYSNNQGTMSMG